MNQSNNDIVVIIPAFNPDEKFIRFLTELKQNGYNNIIVINDGSREDTQHFFDEAVQRFGCKLLSHSINLGQGRAYKTGFNYYLSEKHDGGVFANTIGLIQCDCDGQHDVKDVNHCAEIFRQNPQKFILGVRDFSDKSIPFRSRFGNKCTTFLFRFFCGINIKDTQTGLKGIPAFFIPFLMETPGERFEYASSVLLETKKQGIEILQFPIETIYLNGNETSHFNPVVDSIRIYSLIFRYLLSSLSAFVVDIVTFSILIAITKSLAPEWYVIISTYLARILSCSYSYVVNKRVVFQHKGDNASSIIKFVILCIIQASLSGVFTHLLIRCLLWNEVVVKIIIDTLLFFVSFQVQNRWVFKK